MNKIQRATGRRKTAIAQVILFHKLTGKKTVRISSDNWDNTLDIERYFPSIVLVNNVLKPLQITKTLDKFNVKIKLTGGGFNGQSDAAALGIARALVQFSDDYYAPLKSAKLLTRDSRVKERKKYGLKKARKAPQFSKR